MFQKYIHKVKFYPNADNFTQALLVMLVTNITSARSVSLGSCLLKKFLAPVSILLSRCVGFT